MGEGLRGDGGAEVGEEGEAGGGDGEEGGGGVEVGVGTRVEVKPNEVAGVGRDGEFVGGLGFEDS